MKKITAILILLFIAFAPKPSFSQEETWKKDIKDISAKLFVNSRKLVSIEVDLFRLDRRDKPVVQESLFEVIEFARDGTSWISTIISYEYRLLFTMLYIKDEFISLNCGFRIEELERAKQQLKISLKPLQRAYNVTTLKTIKDAIEITNSSLELFDKSIIILRTLKKEQKN